MRNDYLIILTLFDFMTNLPLSTSLSLFAPSASHDLSYFLSHNWNE